MASLLQRFRGLHPRKRIARSAALQNAVARATLMALPRYQDQRRLVAHGAKAFSQGDEDGIVAEIFRRIGTRFRSCCEIGVGAGDENNTLALLYGGWSVTWIEASARRCAEIRNNLRWAVDAGQLTLLEARVSSENIAALAGKVSAFEQLDLFSIDIDGVDWHVINALPSLRARVVVVEYNAKFPPPIEFVVQNSAGFSWRRDDYFSASLNSWETLMRSKGYALVGCSIAGTNAFFVRHDLVDEQQFLAPFTADNHYEPARYWITQAWSSGHSTSLRAPHR